MDDILKRYKEKAFTIFLILNFSLGLIGPILSFYSLTTELNYQIDRSLIYSISTFLADFISILVVSYIYNKLYLKSDFQYWLLVYTLSYMPIWIADVFDISQYLRFLSSLGLIVSIVVLTFLLKDKLNKKKILIFNTIHIVFYMLDALVSESIATNPILLKIIEKIFY